MTPSDTGPQSSDTTIVVNAPQPDIRRLLSRFQRFLSQQGKMYDARTAADLFEYGALAAGELINVRGYVVLRRRAAGKYEHLFAPSTSSVDALDPAVLEIADWAFDTRRPVFYEVEDPQGRGHISVCVLPVFAEHNVHSAMVLLVDDDLNSVDVLQTELLGMLARDLGARHGSILQAAMHQSLASLFDDIIESVPQAVVAVSSKGTIVALNRNAEFMFDIKRIFAIDETYGEVLPPKVVAAFEGLISRSLIRGVASGDVELELEAPNGMKLNLGISSSVLRDRSGEGRGFLFLTRDLSLTREVQKLNELDRMKSEFVNTVSHELKTPLTAILGGLEVLGYDADRIPEDMKEMFDVVNRGAARLQNLITDLLDVSRLESGKVNMREELVNPKKLLEDAIETLPNSPRHKIILDVEDNAPSIIMDRGKILQCLTNYGTNAIKYSPRGGNVTIRAYVDHERQAMVFSVSDQGLGLSPENQQRVWGKFYRVDSSFTQEIEGTGLGLVIVKATVELHGGSVGVESEQGKGSTFWFRLPLKTA